MQTNHSANLKNYEMEKQEVMTQPDILQSILKDSNYNLSLFSAEEIEALRKKVFTKKTRGKENDPKTPENAVIIQFASEANSL